MKATRAVSARLTMMWGKQQMLVSAAMVPMVAPGFSQDCRYFQPSPAFLKPSNQVAMRRQFALTRDIAKVSLQESGEVVSNGVTFFCCDSHMSARGWFAKSRASCDVTVRKLLRGLVQHIPETEF